jgi:hypothetical protein
MSFEIFILVAVIASFGAGLVAGYLLAKGTLS